MVAVAALACGLLSVLVYMPAVLHNGFINWDDPKYVYDNPLIRSMNSGFFRDILTRPYFNNFHPLTMFSYAVDYRLWGLDPVGYHLTNAVFHGFNTALVFLLAVRLLRAAGVSWPPAGELLAGTVAAVFFGLHPVHVESVVWVSERKDVLSAFFFLLSVLAYIRYSEAKLKRWYGATLFSFVLALMSKPMAVTLPAVLLILDYYPLRRPFTLKTAVAEKFPFFVLGAAYGVVTVLSQQGAFAKEGILTLGARVATAVRAPAFYLYKMALPVDLAPYYPHQVSINFLSAEYIAAALLLAAVTAFSIVAAKRSRVFLSGWLYYLVTLLPVLGLLQVGGQAAADRYTYIPSIAVAVLFGVAAAALAVRLPRLASLYAGAALAVVLAAALGTATVRQAAHWKDSETLWSYEIGLYPEAHLPYNNRGLARQDSAEMTGALKDFSKAVSLAPELAELHNNLAAALHIVGDYAGAVKQYDEAIALDPAAKGYHYNKGLSLQRLGNTTAAIGEYTAEIKLDPLNVEAYRHRGLAFRSLGRADLAINDLTSAVRLSPGEARPYTDRGITYYSVANFELAIQDLKKALSINPDDKAALYYIGVSYAKTGRRAEAVESLRRASSLGLKEAAELLKQLGAK